jgi:hypothetical protein
MSIRNSEIPGALQTDVLHDVLSNASTLEMSRSTLKHYADSGHKEK